MTTPMWDRPLLRSQPAPNVAKVGGVSEARAGQDPLGVVRACTPRSSSPDREANAGDTSVVARPGCAKPGRRYRRGRW